MSHQQAFYLLIALTIGVWQLVRIAGSLRDIQRDLEFIRRDKK